VFVSEGKIADVFKPGMYTLETNNLPILSTIKGWKYGFNSPFKAEVYFVSTRQWTDKKWGTQNPFMMRDPEFGPIRVRAFGSYAFRVSDPAVFMRELVATDPSFESYEIANQLRNVIVSRMVDAMGQSKIPILDLAGNYEKLSQIAKERIAPEMQGMGLTITQFLVENVSLPPDVEQMLDKRSSMAVLGNLDQFTKYQTATAIGDAANNPGGVAGVGAGLGAGVAIGGAMADAMRGTQATASAGGPPPLPGAAAAFFVAMNGAQAGPFDLTTLAAKARAGELTRQSLVWRNGMAGWTAAEGVSELQSLFANVPPPLPPA
jgi:membrane protease subunit (stomatin/prohibitin family)